jgi:hypothetical protein
VLSIYPEPRGDSAINETLDLGQLAASLGLHPLVLGVQFDYLLLVKVYLFFDPTDDGGPFDIDKALGEGSSKLAGGQTLMAKHEHFLVVHAFLQENGLGTLLLSFVLLLETGYLSGILLNNVDDFSDHLFIKDN